MSAPTDTAVSHLVIDTAAAMGIITGDEAGLRLARAIETASRRSMSTANLVELAFILERRLGAAGRGIAERFVKEAEVDVVAVDRVAGELAVHGCYRYSGAQRGGLDLGQCFTYALAANIDGAAVLCTGGEFDDTDVDVARF